ARLLAGLRGEEARHRVRQRVGDRARELARFDPAMAACNRHDEVQALPAGCLDEPAQLETIEECTDVLGGLMHRRPGQRGVRVEIEDDAIGPLESWKARAPRMKFVCAVL